MTGPSSLQAPIALAYQPTLREKAESSKERTERGHGSLVTRAVAAVCIVMPVLCDKVEQLRPANTDQDLEHHTAWTQQLVIPVPS